MSSFKDESEGWPQHQHASIADPMLLLEPAEEELLRESDRSNTPNAAHERDPLLSRTDTDELDKAGKSGLLGLSPSPKWLMPGMFLMALGMGLCIAPKLEIYSLLVCRTLVSPESSSLSSLQSPPGDISSVILNPWIPSWLTAGTLDPESCRHNPVVQRSVAALSTSITLTMGILTALTTGYYGGLSDRRGRTFVMGISLLGLICNDLIFLLTVHYVDTLTYRFLIVAPIIDGLLGGFSTASAALNSYIADCTPAGSRAHTFSVVTGLLFAGIGVGPTLGSLLIARTRNVIAPFYISLSIGIFHCLLVVFFLPESLSKRRQQEGQEKYEAEQKILVEKSQREGYGRVSARLKRFFSFLKPLLLFMPRKPDGDSPEGVHILRPRKEGSNRREWSLTLIALAFGAYYSMISIYPVKMQYAMYKFGWGPVENGYLLTVVGGARVFFLIAILPLAIKIFRKRPMALEDDPNASAESQAQTADINKQQRLVHDSRFDLVLARASIFVDAATYLVLVLGGSSTVFLTCTVFQSIGGGAAPAMQSLALSLTSPKDSGKLFAGFAVLQTVTSQIAGPLAFGLLYTLTVERFSEAIFLVGTLVFSVSFICLILVRLRKPDKEGSIRLV